METETETTAATASTVNDPNTATTSHAGDASNAPITDEATPSSDTIHIANPTEPTPTNDDETSPNEPTQTESTQTEPTTETTHEEKTATNHTDTPQEEKEEKEDASTLPLPSNPSLTAATTTAATPMVPNPMAPLNPMMMPPMMPGLPGMPGMNAPPMMPGFTPYPMFGAPAMLPFMAGLNPNALPTTNTTNKTKTGKRCGDWQSYITEKGKTYYFNVVTKVNTWNKPKEWIEGDTPPKTSTNHHSDSNKSERDSSEPPTVLPSSDSNQQSTTTKSKKDGYLGTAATKELAVIKDNVAKRSFGTMHQSKYKDRSERVKAFRALLKDKEIDADWNWKKVLPKIVTDRRYNALTKLDDKKNELVLWQHDEKKRIQDEEREKRHQLKSGYFELLDEFIDKVIRKEYRKAKHYLESDDRFMAIASKHRREEWFEEWQNSRYKEYKKERKKKKEMALKEFAERLKACEWLKLDSEWADIRPKLSFLNEGFMEQLSERNQEKIFNEMMDEWTERDKEEKRREMKQDRKRFGEFMDELIDTKAVHVKCRYDDAEVMERMAKDERYKKMSAHMHEVKSIFNQKMDALKDELKEDKKVFKQFMRTKEFMIGRDDTWRDMVPQFKQWSANHSLCSKISADHVEHLLAEYVYKKQKELKAHNVNGKEVNVVVNAKKRDRNDMEHVEEEEEPQKKRQKIDQKYVDVTIHDPASYKQKKEEAMDEGEIEELEEGELSDVDIIDNKMKYKMVHKEGGGEDEKIEDHNRNGHCVDRKRSNSLSSRYSGSLSPSHSVKSNRSRSKSSDVSSNGGSRSRSRSRSSNYSFDSNDSNHRKASKKRHKKSGKRHRNASHRNHNRKYDRNHRHHGGHREENKKHREHKKHNREHKENKKKQQRERKRERERQREKESVRVKDNNIDNILYGITSDIDEEDLYYRGDIKRSDQISYEQEGNGNHEEMSQMRSSNVNSNNVNTMNHRKRNQARRGGLRGGLNQWNSNNNPRRHHHHHHHYNKHHYKHHDLDYSNSYSLNDDEINADSYNLDNDEMARWNQ